MHDPQQPNPQDAASQSPTERSENPDAEEQVLVAYLDGELDTEAATQLESRLSRDAVLRGRLRELQQTWDMLDALPQTQPNESFVESTIEMMVTSAQTVRPRWHRWPIRIALGACAFGITALVAFQTVRQIQSQPYREFVRDMDFIENVDTYVAVRDIEFLEQLYEAAIFTEDLAEPP